MEVRRKSFSAGEAMFSRSHENQDLQNLGLQPNNLWGSAKNGSLKLLEKLVDPSPQLICLVSFSFSDKKKKERKRKRNLLALLLVQVKHADIKRLGQLLLLRTRDLVPCEGVNLALGVFLLVDRDVKVDPELSCVGYKELQEVGMAGALTVLATINAATFSAVPKRKSFISEEGGGGGERKMTCHHRRFSEFL